MEYKITFEKLPETIEELKALPFSGRKTPQEAAALTVAALCMYPKNKEVCFQMLDYLRGPRPLSNMDKQFMADRFMDGRDYVPRSYFEGASPDNDYTPRQPFTIAVSDAVHQPIEEDYHAMYIASGGADNPRPITLRLKPSTGEWFLWDHSLLVQIREPKSRDPWA